VAPRWGIATPFAPIVTGAGVPETVVLMHFSKRAVSAFGTTPCSKPGTVIGAALAGVPSAATARSRHATIPRDLTTPAPNGGPLRRDVYTLRLLGSYGLALE
jgi:hypothetical protein